ncbi:P-loop NTPase fold protein [Gottfriedia solisilvae]|uniref:KAP NTPase domain-containing protein n=1 Tax=Gottfriedia solisilvae TaxID=1516104 RepID=A0A8J3AE08_9BACI|nr:P-loop NTPase fold protein [Gottfriedia solisilvae]GGI12597.1 hypothetical protein GCM10007380_13710 [Gottfriedia solisilvae]
MESNIERKKIISFIFYLVLAIFNGIVFRGIASTLFTGITLSYFAKIGLILFTLMTLIFFRELFFYRKTVKQVIKNYLNFIYFLLLVSLTLSIILQSKIESILFIFLALIIVWIFYAFDEQVEIISKHTELSDLPVRSLDELFPTRKKEFNRIYGFLNDLDIYDPYALAISAEWGEGKTSFVNALIENLKEDSNEVIFVQPMIIDTREKLINYVFGQLETIMNQNEIYTGKGSPYQNYFNLLLKLVGNKNINNIVNFFDLFPEDKKEDLREFKENLEINIQKLLDLQKRIIIIIDDLDRVEEETIYSTLTFIKEIVDLKGVIVLLIVDYEKIVSERISVAYLEKFINTKFELKKIENDEIFKHYFETLFPEFKDTFILSELQKLKSSYKDYLEVISTNIKEGIEKDKKKLEKIDKKEVIYQVLSDDINKINEQLKDFNSKLSNPRYIKKIVSGVRESFIFVENNFNSSSSNFDLENDVININLLIFKLNIFKVIFKEIYEKIVKSGDIGLFVDNNTDIFLKSFFRETSKILIYETQQILKSREYEFYNKLIYSDKISSDIFSKIKTKNEELLEELDSMEEIKSEHWNYTKLTEMLVAINYSQEKVSPNILTRRIKTFSDITVDLTNENKITLAQIFELIGNQNRNPIVKYPDFLERTSLLLQESNIEFLNNNEKSTSLYYLENIELQIILDVTGYLHMVCWLYLFEENQYNHGSLKESFEKITSLKVMNELLISLLLEDNKKKELTNSINSIELFNDIYNLIKTKIINIHQNNSEILDAFEHYDEKINSFIQIYILKNKLIQLVLKIPIMNLNRFELQNGSMSVELLINKIDQLYNFLEDSQNIIDYQHFSYFHSIINEIGWLNKQVLNEEYHIKLRKSYINLKQKLNEEIMLYDRFNWSYCQIKFADIQQKYTNY